MTVFAFSVIVNAAGLNLRDLRVQDLNPRTWYSRANRSGHLMYAHAEKFYYDLRMVYLIESRFRELRSQPEDQQEGAPAPAAPSGGTSLETPFGHTQFASNAGRGLVALAATGESAAPIPQAGLTESRRRIIP